jgi:hypothetical protein
MRLITSYFQASTKERQAEIDKCLLKNLTNPVISEVVVLDETGTLESKGKLKAVPHGRPTYADMIAQFTDGVNIISNSDIWFNETIEKAERVKTGKCCYAITRTEQRGPDLLAFDVFHPKGCAPYYSQDVWVFRGRHELKNMGAVEAWSNVERRTEIIPFNLGIGGCDNIFVANLREQGYDIRNPYKEIICIHEHADQGRPVYSHRITGGRGTWGRIGNGKVMNYSL